MKHLCTLFFVIGISWCGLAQQTVTGNVVDEDGVTLPGVSVIEKGTQHGVITDFDGNFTISVPEDAILMFSFVGFQKQDVKVQGRSSFDLTMKTNVESLSKVVVVGYGKQRKESVLSAINQIPSEDIEKAGTPNLVNSLSGLAPGLNVVVNSGQPGSEGGDIFIRGNSNPLVLVDGVEVVGGISNINPRDVESISVLKDGAATAVYGVKGANGVIIVTTKRGTLGAPKVSINSELGFKKPIREPNMLGAYRAQRALNDGVLNDQAFDAGFSTDKDLNYWKTGELPYIYPDTDWFDLLVKKTVISNDHTVNIRGGDKSVKYFASAGYLNEGDIFKTKQFYNYDPKFNFSRYSFRANIDFNITKTTKLKTSISNRLEDQKEPVTSFNKIKGVYTGLYTSAPGGVVPVYPDNILDKYPDPDYPGTIAHRFGTGDNLYSAINTDGFTRSYTSVFKTDFELEQKLDFITKGLTFIGKYNYVKAATSSKSVQRDRSISVRVNTFTLQRDSTWTSFEGPNYQDQKKFRLTNEGLKNTRDIIYGRAQLRYKRDFRKNHVTGMFLVSRNKRTVGTNYPYFNEDWVYRGTYNYDHKYFFEFAGAVNGDETFASGHRFQYFPSFAVGYNLAKTKLVKKHFPVVSNFKLRYDYGETGQKSGLGNNRYLYLSFYGYSNPYTNNRYYFGKDQNRQLQLIIDKQLGNPDLSWATVTKQNVGVDFGFFKQSLTGSLDFFNDRRDGLIVVPQATVPSYLGTSVNLPFINYGKTKSHGYEVQLNYHHKTAYGLDYSLGGFYGFNENRVVRSAKDGVGTPEYARQAGKPSGVSPLLQADGYFQNIDEVVNYPEFARSPGLGDYRYIDFNSNGTVIADATEDQIRYNLPRSPRKSYSFNFSASYKGFTLSGNLNGTIDHKGFESDELTYILPNNGTPVGRVPQLDYWTPNNPNAAYPSPHTKSNPNLTGHTGRIINSSYAVS